LEECDKMKEIVLPLIAAVLFFMFICPAVSNAKVYDLGYTDSVPGPTLLYPITDNIVLNGKDKLEFKWMTGGLVNTRYYEFKIYKGYNMYAKYLIYRCQAPADIEPFTVPVSLFTENQVYTWSIRQVFSSGLKSDKSFSPFKIIKK